MVRGAVRPAAMVCVPIMPDDAIMRSLENVSDRYRSARRVVGRLSRINSGEAL